MPHVATLNVATLISDPAAPALDAALLRRAATVLPQPGAPVWLAPGIAADLPFDGAGADPAALTEHLRAALQPAPVDVAVQPAEGRRKKLFVADMDSTLIGQECIDELADFAGYQENFLRLFGFGLPGVDYKADVSPNVPVPSVAAAS